jgi:hypothetical protein
MLHVGTYISNFGPVIYFHVPYFISNIIKFLKMGRKIPQIQTSKMAPICGHIKTGTPALLFVLNSTYIYKRLVIAAKI